MKKIIFMTIALVSSFIIECQVILNRAQLAAWIPFYATNTKIKLDSRGIQSIEATTFSKSNCARNPE